MSFHYQKIVKVMFIIVVFIPYIAVFQLPLALVTEANQGLLAVVFSLNMKSVQVFIRNIFLFSFPNWSAKMSIQSVKMTLESMNIFFLFRERETLKILVFVFLYYLFLILFKQLYSSISSLGFGSSKIEMDCEP